MIHHRPPSPAGIARIFTCVQYAQDMPRAMIAGKRVTTMACFRHPRLQAGYDSTMTQLVVVFRACDS
ncbi:hypothetical protein VFPPC_03710 [Pochonia chlamydosporia 170]|uniref:Uncharacterized protein n=1 Tax=Pochonia chlamydosporia 170 TaxID=1380566 RepID=A0A179G236_METCM|nr:hypothetical protein VFPPC_03710 [Pochonia chlamydosporia 170]OAQ71411.2 hypothetical protein VFPPC_03710 [Pochonia chlamydosporia 170]